MIDRIKVGRIYVVTLRGIEEPFRGMCAEAADKAPWIVLGHTHIRTDEIAAFHEEEK